MHNIFQLSLFVLLAYPLHQGQASDFTEQAHSRVRFVSETKNLVRGTNWLGLFIQLDPKWHTYWQNPGDSASAPHFEFGLPRGISLTSIHFPTPKRIPFGPLQSFGYEDEVLLLFEIEVSQISNPTALIKLDVEWLVCKEECVPGVYTFKMERQVGGARRASDFAPAFARFRSELPLRISRKGEISLINNQVLVSWPKDLNLEVRDALPFTNQLVTNAPPNISKNQLSFVPVSSRANKISGPFDQSFLLLTEGRAKILPATGQGPDLLKMILFAFIGGLILNLMPCVFPVLTLKIFTVIEAQQHFRQRMRSNGAYLLGILLSFWILSTALIGFRSMGQNLGWGFHLQSPLFVSLLIALFAVLGLSFLGFVPLNFSRLVNLSGRIKAQSQILDSFLTGVLAVVVASPCTAPLMGAAIGFALTQSTWTILTIFTALGVGLAFPYLLLCLLPNSLNFLPRPGPWMDRFKKLMALPMFGTVIWLSWVLSLQLSSSVEIKGDWEAFTPQKFDAKIQNQKPLFVNFTAAWCITCQVNEKLVFQSQQVVGFFRKNEIQLMKVDWTKKDNEIGQILKKYNRAGVPLYLFFPPGRKNPIILPEILTVDLLISNLSQ